LAALAPSLERLVDNALVLEGFLTWADTNNVDCAPMVRTGDESGPADGSKMAGVAGSIFVNRPVNGVSTKDSVFDSVVAATHRSDAGAFTAVPRGPSRWQVQSQESLM